MLAYHLDIVLGGAKTGDDGADDEDDSSESESDADVALPGKKPLSLDDEIAQLRNEGKKDRGGRGKSARGIDVVDTGVTGLLIAFFTGCERANFSLRETKAGGNKAAVAADTADGADDADEVGDAANKKAKTAFAEKKPAAAAKAANLFPATVVNSVVSSIIASLSSSSDDDTSSPRSRFVHRLLPLSSTCYPSIGELRLAAQPVVSEMLRLASRSHPPSAASAGRPKPTFSVQFKSRVCDSCPSRDDVISCVAGLVPDEEFKVDLEDPDFTILVEVCKNLAAVGLCEQYTRRRKYNLLEIGTEANNERHDRRDAAAKRREDDDDDDNDNV